MLQTEYIRSLNCNYERMLLDKKPEENRYQYCIVTRGGIRGLLPCSLRYINGQAYLYYDISSTQSVAQLYLHKPIGRQWMKDFLWGMRRIQQELGRFLLDDANLLWYPEQIFQDLEKNDFYFLYVPYYEDKNGFDQLLDYLVEHIDYEDEQLVECVYKMHEQFELLGNVYLAERIFEDGKLLERSQEESVKECSAGEQAGVEEIETKRPVVQRAAYEAGWKETDNMIIEASDSDRDAEREQDTVRESKRGIRYFLDGKRKKQKEEREQIRSQTGRMMQGYAVCEESNYREVPRGKEKINEQMEELGRTMYMEEAGEEPKDGNGLFNENGKEVLRLDGRSVIIGKKKDEADCVLEDASVSRMHARITKEKEGFYLEDLNSTNGTWKNGLRLHPYEKRKLEKEDEIKLGKVILFYR